MNRTTYDPEKFNLDVASMKKAGESFEIVVDADEAIKFRENKGGDILDVLKDEKIFSDAQRGQLAPESKFQGAFETDDVLKIAEQILKEGEIRLTAEHRKKAIERKRSQLVNLIQRNAIDPRINAPHTKTRVEDAFEVAKISVDEFKAAEEQVKDIIRKLQPVLPLKFEVKQIEMHVDSKYSHAVYGYLKKNFKIIKNIWIENDWTGVVEVPGGLEVDFYDAINNMTHGGVNMKVIGE